MKRLPLALLAVIGGCTEYEFTDDIQVDVFQQIQRNTVDILLVVDNSCSMYEEQDNLASSFEAFIEAFVTAEADYQIAAVTTDMAQEQFSGRMLGGDDEIILSCPSNSDPTSMVRIDEVDYTRDWDLETGASIALDPSITSSATNDVRDSWCISTATFGSGDAGSPGEANPACGASSPPPPGGDTADPGKGTDTDVDVDTGGTDTAVTTDTGRPADTGKTTDTGQADTGSTGESTNYPAGGKILITEFLADPEAVSDTVGEWVELTNVGDQTYELGGCTLTDGGVNTYTLPDGLELEAGGILVVGASDDTGANGGAPVDVAVSNFTLQNNVVLLTPDTEDPQHIFAEMVAVGIDGSGIEMGLEAAYAALSDPLVNTANIGFLREEASLSLIFVSDEEDHSPLAPHEYTTFFTELKGEEAYRDHSLMRASAVVGSDKPQFDGQPSCQSANGEATYGGRYIEVAGRTEGLIESICEEDFSPLATELGLTISGLVVEFELSASPDENTLEVFLYEDETNDSLVGLLEPEVDYSYVRERNSIRFEDTQVPPPNYYISVEYKVLATGASQSSDTGGAR